jgi:hypothetical protein
MSACVPVGSSPGGTTFPASICWGSLAFCARSPGAGTPGPAAWEIGAPPRPRRMTEQPTATAAPSSNPGDVDPVGMPVAADQGGAERAGGVGCERRRAAERPIRTRLAIDRSRLEQGERDVGHALPEPLELRLVAYVARSAVLPSQRVRVMPSKATVMRSLSAPSRMRRKLRSATPSRIAPLPERSRDARALHMGDCACSGRPSAVARATASDR